MRGCILPHFHILFGTCKQEHIDSSRAVECKGKCPIIQCLDYSSVECCSRDIPSSFPIGTQFLSRFCGFYGFIRNLLCLESLKPSENFNSLGFTDFSRFTMSLVLSLHIKYTSRQLEI
jgi:hypothetical protein